MMEMRIQILEDSKPMKFGDKKAKGSQMSIKRIEFLDYPST